MEKELIINNRELLYSGVFRTEDLFRIINQAIVENGYKKVEKKSEEVVTEQGRKSYIELRPIKAKTNYFNLMIKIKINLDNIKEIVEETKNGKGLFQQGNIKIVFDSWILSDYEHRWGMKPWVYFMKAVIHKYVYKFPLEEGFRGELTADTAKIYAKIKKLLNSYKEETGKFTKEEDIKKEVDEEIKEEINTEIGQDETPHNEV